eukprot:303410_1
MSFIYVYLVFHITASNRVRNTEIDIVHENLKHESNSTANLTILNDDYDIWCTGLCPPSRFGRNPHYGIILMGGSTDVDSAIRQQIDWSDCGDFLVLRTSGSDGYNSYIYNLGCASSVTTIRINNRNGANDPTVIDYINEAEAIFFAGGDQSSYLNYWQGTQLQSAVQSAVNNRNVPIGGTSAGAMIQTQYIFSAENGGVYSDEALSDPYNRYMTFAQNFITQKNSLLVNMIVDTHFQERDRFGRLFAMVGRLRTDNNYANIMGIGVNERTAIVIDGSTFIGTVYGTGDVFMILPGDNNPIRCSSGQSLIWRNVNTTKLEGYYDDTWNFQSLSGGHPNLQYTVGTHVNGGDTMAGDPYRP